jgi:hypothetical protein
MSDQEPQSQPQSQPQEQPQSQPQEQPHDEQPQEEPKEQKVVITYMTHTIVAKTRVPGKQIPKKITTVIE